MYLPEARIFVRSFHLGHQSHHQVTSGSVSYSPADGHRRTLVGEHNPAHDYFTLLIPRRAVGLLAGSEGTIWNFDDLNCFISPHDAILRWCMERLSVPPSGIRELQLRKDEAARRLLFRLQELGGGRAFAYLAEKPQAPQLFGLTDLDEETVLGMIDALQERVPQTLAIILLEQQESQDPDDAGAPDGPVLSMPDNR
jgi:hypothetical protein